MGTNVMVMDSAAFLDDKQILHAIIVELNFIRASAR